MRRVAETASATLGGLSTGRSMLVYCDTTGVSSIWLAAALSHFPHSYRLIQIPCSCGYRSDLAACSCTPPQVEKYPSKISGPLAGPDRPARRGPRGPLHPTGRDAARPDFGSLAGRGAGSTCSPVQTLRPQGPQVDGRMTLRHLQAQARVDGALWKAAMEDLGFLSLAHDNVLVRAPYDRRSRRSRRHQAPSHRRSRGISLARSERLDAESRLRRIIRKARHRE